MKLLVDGYINSSQETLVSSLVEDTGKAKKYYIEGIFAQAIKPNRNGRTYPKSVLEKAVAAYVPAIAAKRSLGELNHPNIPSINFERASHIIESLTWEGNDVIGRAKIMTSMPMGIIAKNLIDEGVQLGVSTRGMGSLKSIGGLNEVQSDYTLNTIDIVSDPSGIDCFVAGLMENREWIMESGIWVEKQIDDAQKLMKSAGTNSLVEMQAYVFQKLLKGIK